MKSLVEVALLKRAEEQCQNPWHCDKCEEPAPRLWRTGRGGAVKRLCFRCMFPKEVEG
jgi:hypothetical protein